MGLCVQAGGPRCTQQEGCRPPSLTVPVVDAGPHVGLAGCGRRGHLRRRRRVLCARWPTMRDHFGHCGGKPGEHSCSCPQVPSCPSSSRSQPGLFASHQSLRLLPSPSANNNEPSAYLHVEAVLVLLARRAAHRVRPMLCHGDGDRRGDHHGGRLGARQNRAPAPCVRPPTTQASCARERLHFAGGHLFSATGGVAGGREAKAKGKALAWRKARLLEHGTAHWLIGESLPRVAAVSLGGSKP